MTRKLMLTVPAYAQIVTNSQVNETYVLYQCGLTAPNNALLPPGAKVFSIPLTSVAVGDTVPLAFLVWPLACMGMDARKPHGTC